MLMVGILHCCGILKMIVFTYKTCDITCLPNIHERWCYFKTVWMGFWYYIYLVRFEMRFIEPIAKKVQHDLSNTMWYDEATR